VIPELPRSYVDHLVEPRGLGDVQEAHAAGEVGSMVGGLGVRISLAYRSAHTNGSVIGEIRGRAFGSAAAIAPLSWLTEAVSSQGYEEACRHTPASVLAALCDGRDDAEVLPEPVRRAAGFAVQALRRALGVTGHPADPTGGGILVCRCLGVGDRTIRCAIAAGARDPEAVGEACRASTGCRSCRPDILALIDEETRPPPPPPPADLHPVVRITLARAGPLLRGLGMPLEGASLVGDRVALALGKPGAGATVSPIGAIALTRHLLRETVGEGVQVGILA
jgi:bacterioferritin-associated ferredoxin